MHSNGIKTIITSIKSMTSTVLLNLLILWLSRIMCAQSKFESELMIWQNEDIEGMVVENKDLIGLNGIFEFLSMAKIDLKFIKWMDKIDCDLWGLVKWKDNELKYLFSSKATFSKVEEWKSEEWVKWRNKWVNWK